MEEPANGGSIPLYWARLPLHTIRVGLQVQKRCICGHLWLPELRDVTVANVAVAALRKQSGCSGTGAPALRSGASPLRHSSSLRLFTATTLSGFYPLISALPASSWDPIYLLVRAFFCLVGLKTRPDYGPGSERNGVLKLCQVHAEN